MNISINRKSMLITSAVLLYFVALAIQTQSASTFSRLFWYGALVFGTCVSLFYNQHFLRKPFAFFLLLYTATGVMNYFLIGTIPLTSFVLLYFQFFIALLFFDDHFNYKSLIAVFILNVAIVLYRFLIGGLRGQIYIASSNNFVSVYLLYPIILYYTLAEYRNEKPRFWPLVAFWIMSLLSRGRGGIIASSFLLICLAWIFFKRKKLDFRGVCIILVFVVLVVVAVNANRLLSKVNGSVISETFRDRGMNSSRTILWKDYLTQTKSDIKYVLFGTDIHTTLAWTKYLGNCHNSLINIHSNNGILCLLYILIVSVKECLYSLKKHSPVFFVCFVTLFLRGFTDNVFWMTYGTVPLFVMLFLYAVPQNRISRYNRKSGNYGKGLITDKSAS